MANEITINLSMSVTNGNFKDTFQPGSLLRNQATVGGNRPVSIVNSSAWESVPFGDVSTPGFMVGRNTSTASSTNTWVSVAVSTSTGSAPSAAAFAKIKAGDPFLIPLSTGLSGLLKWRGSTASTAPQRIDARIYEA